MHDKTDAIDPLSRTLASFSLPNWQAGVTTLTLPWGFAVPDGFVSFYAVKAGDCWVTTDTAPTRLRSGDILLVADGSAHELRGELGCSTTPFCEVLAPDRAGNWAEPGDPGISTLVHGHAAVGAHGINPFQTTLPALLHINTKDHDVLKDAGALFRLIAAERASPRPGWHAVVRQLVHVLLHQALRAFVAECTDAQAGTQAISLASTTMDPLIGPVIGLIHSEPEKPWTVATLARQVNMSRSAFSDRFREVVGQPPLQYLTELRMHRACELLSTSDLGIKQIASLVGYESPSSFTSAFKRRTGSPPASYRRLEAR